MRAPPKKRVSLSPGQSDRGQAAGGNTPLPCPAVCANGTELGDHRAPSGKLSTRRTRATGRSITGRPAPPDIPASERRVVSGMDGPVCADPGCARPRCQSRCIGPIYGARSPHTTSLQPDDRVQQNRGAARRGRCVSTKVQTCFETSSCPRPPWFFINWAALLTARRVPTRWLTGPMATVPPRGPIKNGLTRWLTGSG
jgi:hypothetical protein